MDELCTGEVVLVGQMENAEGRADDDDSDENRIGHGTTKALLNLDSQEVSTKRENDAEERNDSRRKTMGHSHPVHRFSCSREARRPKTCMIHAVDTSVIRVLPMRPIEIGSHSLRRSAKFATIPTPAGTNRSPN